jgi:phosphopantetheine--protein transferase-like protein
MVVSPGPFPATYGELEARVTGITAGASPGALPSFPPVRATANTGVAVGLDVESVSALPATPDFWEHDFYRQTFGKREIAYAVAQADPRVHFAGYWCAKEALRKCDPAFDAAGPLSIVVTHDDMGRPYLEHETSTGRTRLPHAVSISHTGEVACAVVVSAPPSSRTAEEVSAAERQAPAPRPSPFRALFVAVFTFMIAAAAFLLGRAMR